MIEFPPPGPGLTIHPIEETTPARYPVRISRGDALNISYYFRYYTMSPARILKDGLRYSTAGPAGSWWLVWMLFWPSASPWPCTNTKSYSPGVANPSVLSKVRKSSTFSSLLADLRNSRTFMSQLICDIFVGQYDQKCILCSIDARNTCLACRWKHVIWDDSDGYLCSPLRSVCSDAALSCHLPNGNSRRVLAHCREHLAALLARMVVYPGERRIIHHAG
jgi:hypothetical protein